MKFTPLQDRVIIKRLEEENKTKGGSLFLMLLRRNPRRAAWSPSAAAR